MRQCRNLRRQSQVRQHLGDVRFPGACALQTGAEAIGLPELKAHIIHRCRQPRRRDVHPPQVAHVALLVGLRRDAAGQTPQDILYVAALGIHATRTFALRRVGIEVNGFVDHRQIVLVVNETLVGADLAIDADPELHIGLEFLRSRQRILGGGGECRQTDQSNGQQESFHACRHNMGAQAEAVATSHSRNRYWRVHLSGIFDPTV